MTTTEFCETVLPSGSGFDCKWCFVKRQKNGSMVFETHFHNMNENGYYDGFTKVRLTIPKILTDFRLTLSEGKARYMDWSTRDYFADTIYECLRGKAFTWECDYE